MVNAIVSMRRMNQTARNMPIAAVHTSGGVLMESAYRGPGGVMEYRTVLTDPTNFRTFATQTGRVNQVTCAAMTTDVFCATSCVMEFSSVMTVLMNRAAVRVFAAKRNGSVSLDSVYHGIDSVMRFLTALTRATKERCVRLTLRARTTTTAAHRTSAVGFPSELFPSCSNILCNILLTSSHSLSSHDARVQRESG